VQVAEELADGFEHAIDELFDGGEDHGEVLVDGGEQVGLYVSHDDIDGFDNLSKAERSRCQGGLDMDLQPSHQP
jgi:hypothetical protein